MLIETKFFNSSMETIMIDRWRIVMTDENGTDIDLDMDIPDHITEVIDEIIESDNDVSWGT